MKVVRAMSKALGSPCPVPLRAALSLALAFLGASPVVALQDAEDAAAQAAQIELESEIEEICVNFVCLEGADRAQYLAMRERIDATLGPASSVEERMGAIAELLAAIDDLEGFDPSFRHSLWQEVLGSAEAVGALDSPLIVALLRSEDEDLEDFALSALFSGAEAAWREESIHRALLELLHDADRSEDSRGSVLWLFQFKGGFSEVSDDALAATGDEQAPELAHTAAEVLIHEARSGDGETWTREAFLSGPPALRREAARHLLTGGYLQPSDPLFKLAVRTMAAVALDSEAPPHWRGRAIQAIDGEPTAEPNRSVLLKLLEPQNWFYGATGAHFPVHSLALVIGALKGVEDPAVRNRLEALRGEVRALPSGQREYVEWVLGNVLGDYREIFHGPVEWEDKG